MDSRRRAITYNFRHKGLKEPGLGGGGTSVLLLKGWRQEDGKFQDSLGYIARPHLTKVKNKTKEQNEQIPPPRFLVSDFFDSYPRYQLPSHADPPDGNPRHTS